MRRLLPLLAVTVALAACGDDLPTDEQQVRETLMRFATSVEERDYETLCGEVFAPVLLDGLQQIGLPCEVAMRTSLGEVEAPKLTVGEIAIDGTTASAEVRTSAAGQDPSSDTLQLTKVEDRWRVSALGADPGATPTPEATPSPSP